MSGGTAGKLWCGICGIEMSKEGIEGHIIEYHTGYGGNHLKCGECVFEATSINLMSSHCLVTTHNPIRVQIAQNHLQYSDKYFRCLADIMGIETPPSIPSPTRSFEATAPASVVTNYQQHFRQHQPQIPPVQQMTPAQMAFNSNGMNGGNSSLNGNNSNNNRLVANWKGRQPEKGPFINVSSLASSGTPTSFPSSSPAFHPRRNPNASLLSILPTAPTSNVNPRHRRKRQQQQHQQLLQQQQKQHQQQLLSSKRVKWSESNNKNNNSKTNNNYDNIKDREEQWTTAAASNDGQSNNNNNLAMTKIEPPDEEEGDDNQQSSGNDNNNNIDHSTSMISSIEAELMGIHHPRRPRRKNNSESDSTDGGETEGDENDGNSAAGAEAEEEEEESEEAEEDQHDRGEDNLSKLKVRQRRSRKGQNYMVSPVTGTKFINVTKSKFRPSPKLTFEQHEQQQGQRPRLECRTCPKTFAGPSALRTHERIHTNDYPYECSECGKRFNQKGGLKTHTIVHHTHEYPHTCIDCGKGFLNRTELERHQIKVH